MWNLAEFRSLVEGRYGAVARGAMCRPLNSIAWKFALARYHATESRTVLDDHVGGNNGQRVVNAVGGLLHRASGAEDSAAFERACFAAEAHVIACAMTLNSVADSVAHVLCHGLELDVAARRKRQLTLHHVRDSLATRPDAGGVVAAIDDFLAAKEIRYLRAFANTAKHHSLVDMQYQVRLDPWETAGHGLRIKAFEYVRGRAVERWPEKWSQDFTGDDLDAVSKMVGRIGNSVNKLLRD